MTGPYQAHDASAENGGVPVFNVKGPGYDSLVVWRGVMPEGTQERAELAVALRRTADEIAEAMNHAYREGVKAGRDGK